jgi:hypothetical protein
MTPSDPSRELLQGVLALGPKRVDRLDRQGAPGGRRTRQSACAEPSRNLEGGQNVGSWIS